MKALFLLTLTLTGCLVTTMDGEVPPVEQGYLYRCVYAYNKVEHVKSVCAMSPTGAVDQLDTRVHWDPGTRITCTQTFSICLIYPDVPGVDAGVD